MKYFLICMSVIDLCVMICFLSFFMFVFVPRYRLDLSEMTELISLQIYSCQFTNPSHGIYKTFILFYWHIVGCICYCSDSVNNRDSRNAEVGTTKLRVFVVPLANTKQNYIFEFMGAFSS